ncbi:MAG: chemotaxis response regulator protein-glutamate methylesterase [Deltaproteobacteria bacterium GWB2_55_19]|nr:MAG: chemotaxis response regulator protein-glutamate methylesterase [Deltaproteobacteria bacterium GWB2_55_19]HAO92717.1 chemotaxis response regulator protein-glutamate methylesterase [Deltaproteobacteria bacterium]
MITVLIVDDSAVARQHLRHILESDPDIHVIGTAVDGEEAVELLKERTPDVITMDINMPGMNGHEATRAIMETNPVPIVIVSASYERSDVEKSFRAMEAGAVAILEKPAGSGHPDFESTSRELLKTVKLMSEVRVVRRWPHGRRKEARSEAETSVKKPKLVAIGASTGGPPVIQTILSGLKPGFLAPVMIVQHISKGFIDGMTEWLSSETGLPIVIASDGETLKPGRIYFAPDGYHMGVASNGRVSLSKAPPENGIRPSVAHLFRSAIAAYGPDAVGILLTGMGKDGAMELKQMRDSGSLTIAQDKESSVIYGMPGEAVRLDGATLVLPPERIAARLASLIGANGQSN